MQIEHLQWDSDFFNLRIGRVVCEKDCNEDGLRLLLEAGAANYDLVYVFSEKELDMVPRSGEFKLVDKKIIYSGNISCENITEKRYAGISFYKGKKSTSVLRNLAWTSAGHSRYKIDGNFGNEAYKKLYSAWIANSLDGKLADKVVCHKTDGVVDAIMTVKIKGTVADIGLVAVSESRQGEGVGTRMMDFAKQKLAEMGVSALTVATQQDNVQACRYYAKQGLQPSAPTYVYHFWTGR